MKDKKGIKSGVEWWITYEKELIVINTQKKGSKEQFRATHKCLHPIVDRKYDPIDIKAVESLLAREIDLTGKGK